MAKYYYHITPSRNVSSILRGGLIPRKASNIGRGWDLTYKKRVYLSGSISDILELIPDLGLASYSVLKVEKPKGLKIHWDETDEGQHNTSNVYVTGTIPPSHIKGVYKLTKGDEKDLGRTYELRTSGPFILPSLLDTKLVGRFK